MAQWVGFTSSPRNVFYMLFVEVRCNGAAAAGRVTCEVATTGGGGPENEFM
jgi:hypothetical protein